MKYNPLCAALALFCCVLASPIAGSTGSCREPAPIAVVPESDYTFAPVVDGTRVTHEFVLQNQGTAVLEIARVKTG